jgi:hypothetical protein
LREERCAPAAPGDTLGFGRLGGMAAAGALWATGAPRSVQRLPVEEVVA